MLKTPLSLSQHIHTMSHLLQDSPRAASFKPIQNSFGISSGAPDIFEPPMVPRNEKSRFAALPSLSPEENVHDTLGRLFCDEELEEYGDSISPVDRA